MRPLVLPLQQTIFRPVSDVFVDLQEARHKADYDHLTTFSKATATAHVRDAERAIRDISTAADADRQAFAVLVAMKA